MKTSKNDLLKFLATVSQSVQESDCKEYDLEFELTKTGIIEHPEGPDEKLFKRYLNLEGFNLKIELSKPNKTVSGALKKERQNEKDQN